MHSGRILVVEPDDDLRRSLTFVLAAYGYTVVADQGWPADAISGAFDCIVLDEQVMSKSSALPRVLLSGWPRYSCSPIPKARWLMRLSPG